MYSRRWKVTFFSLSYFLLTPKLYRNSLRVYSGPVVCKRIISQLQYSVLACARNSTSPRVQLRCWWNDAPVPWRRRHPRTARWICTKSITVVLLTSRPWNCGKNWTKVNLYLFLVPINLLMHPTPTNTTMIRFSEQSRSRSLTFSDVCNADLSSYSAQCVAGVLKKFLRELPDPVIPVQFYDRFIEASSEYYA